MVIPTIERSESQYVRIFNLYVISNGENSNCVSLRRTCFARYIQGCPSRNDTGVSRGLPPTITTFPRLTFPIRPRLSPLNGRQQGTVVLRNRRRTADPLAKRSTTSARRPRAFRRDDPRARLSERLRRYRTDDGRGCDSHRDCRRIVDWFGRRSREGTDTALEFYPVRQIKIPLPGSTISLYRIEDKTELADSLRGVKSNAVGGE